MHFLNELRHLSKEKGETLLGENSDSPIRINFNFLSLFKFVLLLLFTHVCRGRNFNHSINSLRIIM